MSNKIINIPGRLHSVSTEGVVTGADEILDDSLNKTQTQFNQETNARIEALQEGTLIIVSELPTTGVAGKIYRVPGDGSYTDYMWDTSQQPAAFVALATYTGNEGDFFNVNVYNGVPTTAYSTTDIARADVPAGMRKQGLQITYLLADGWFTDQYIGSAVDSESWATATNWKTLGPVSVSQNTLSIGSEEVGELAGQLIENPEWDRVVTDSEDKILYGVKTDGKFYFGGGCPPQVQEYIQNIINGLSLDEYEDIVAFLNDYLGSDITLKAMIDSINAQIITKVDNVEGKSLIPVQYIQEVENPEFVDAKTDNDDKLLEGTKTDGTKVFGADVVFRGKQSIGEVEYNVVSNPEYLAAWLDAKNKIVFGFKTDGKTYVGDADFLKEIKNNQETINVIKSYLANLDFDALSSITAVENSEFIDVQTDSEGKILSSRDNDGVKKEHVGFETPKVSIDGHTIKNIEDPEGRTEITTDAEGKIISYRDSDGVKHEEVGIETNNVTVNHLNLTETGMTEFQQALKDAGMQNGGHDFSDDENIELPEPVHYGMLNLIIDSLPNNDGEVSEGFAEYYDFAGNYFKITCSIETQGQTSKIFASTGGKGNYTLDLEKEVKF